MKLFYSPGACSLNPHIVLRECALPFELVRTDLAAKKLADGADFLALNPKGQVPFLVLDDGQGISEGPVITQYLADQAGRTDLLPAAGTLARVRVQEALNFVSTEIHKGYSPLFMKTMPDAGKAAMTERLMQRYTYANRVLEGRSWLVGDACTLADFYFYVCTRWGVGMKLDFAACPNVLAHQARVGERPAVQAALQAEGLVKA